MAAKIRLADGREMTVALDGKKVVEALEKVTENQTFTRFNTPNRGRVWISASHVAAIEDRPDLD
jgi:hypothetical protein